MGEKGKDNEAALIMNKDALTLRSPYRASTFVREVQSVILECAHRTMLKHSTLSRCALARYGATGTIVSALTVSP